MSERVFASGPDFNRRDEIATARAAALTEMLLDEIARAHHNWHTIAQMARALSRLSSAMEPRHEHPRRLR